MNGAEHNKIMVINAGSSSVRIGLYACINSQLQQLADYHAETTISSPDNAVRQFLTEQGINSDILIAHRVVHGGALFKQPVVIDDSVKLAIEQLSVLAPLHNPRALELIQICDKVFAGQAKQIAVFDTAFFHDLPAVARTYALPYAVSTKYGIHRYGFHGIAHEYMWRKWCELTDNKEQDGKVVTIQLGSGCSITATKNGQPLDTSMGFSPLEGLVMATRSGDVDPGILTYLQTVAGYSVKELELMLNKESGLLGISGKSGDIRDLLSSSDMQAKLALDVFMYRLRKYIGSYLAALNGAQAIILGGGIGENNPNVRAGVFEALSWFGLKLDADKNARAIGTNTCISSPDSRVKIWTVKINEAELIADKVLKCRAE